MPDRSRFCTTCGREAAAPAPPPAHTGEPDPAPAPPPAHPERPDAAPAPPPAHVPSERGRAAPAPPPAHDGPAVAAAGFPPWVPAAWAPALRMALVALAVGLGGQYVLGVAVVGVQTLSGAGVDWGATLRAPLDVFLALHGPVEGLGLWATGTGWILAAFWVAGRKERVAGGRGLRAGAVLALQAAAAYAVPVTVLALLVSPEALPITVTAGGTAPLVAGSFVDPAAFGAWQPWSAALLGGGAAAAAAFLSITGAGAASAVAGRLPAPLSAGLVGARSLLGAAVPAAAGVVAVGTVVEGLRAGLDPMLAVAFALTVLLAVAAWGGVDVGVAFLVFGMRFFVGDGGVVLAGRPAWVYACVAVVGFGFARGGLAAARALGPASRNETLLAGAAAGVVGAAALSFAAALAPGSSGSLAGPALGLGLAWTALSVAAAAAATGRRGARAAPPPAH
ncbi:MAG: hypothetical protein KQH83_06465 [Actinobacteria bacterium]|nr:hypothetical protein [Actinomycetota bacterium]